MGVGALAALLWAVATAAAGLLGPPLPWGASVLALVAAGLAFGRQGALRSALIAVAAAPFWVSAATRPAAPPLAEGSALLVAVPAAALLVLGRPALPRAVPWAALGAGLVLAARQLAAARSLPYAASTAWDLLLVGLALGGLTAGARPGRAAGLALLLAGGVSGYRVVEAARAAPRDREEVEAAAATGVLRLHLGSLAAAPKRGLDAIALDPGWHALALALSPATGTDALLDAGWRPERATLPADPRLDLARRLDERGAGGRAIRLLRAGRADPAVAWTLELYERQAGRTSSWSGGAPVGVPVLPGEIAAGWAFFSDGQATLDWHASEDVAALSLELVGTPYEGAPTLLARVDASEARRFEAPARLARVTLEGPFAAGPHRLVARFDNDRAGPNGDRNVFVLSIQAAPSR